MAFKIKSWLGLLVLMMVLSANAVQAEGVTLTLFVSGSYQQILSNNTGKPFMLVIWSLTCSSCLKDMALLNRLHKNRPDIKMIMLATDGVAASDQIEKILQKNELTTLENWVYADENSQKLQYEIDSTWYGELPRTYFFNKAHQREGMSGVLTETNYLTNFDKILR